MVKQLFSRYTHALSTVSLVRLQDQQLLLRLTPSAKSPWEHEVLLYHSGWLQSHSLREAANKLPRHKRLIVASLDDDLTTHDIVYVDSEATPQEITTQVTEPNSYCDWQPLFSDNPQATKAIRVVKAQSSSVQPLLSACRAARLKIHCLEPAVFSLMRYTNAVYQTTSELIALLHPVCTSLRLIVFQAQRLIFTAQQSHTHNAGSNLLQQFQQQFPAMALDKLLLWPTLTEKDFSTSHPNSTTLHTTCSDLLTSVALGGALWKAKS